MKERWHPSICDQDQYVEWVQKGKKDNLTKAKEKIREILVLLLRGNNISYPYLILFKEKRGRMIKEIEIQIASDKDTGLLLSLIRELADVEGLSDKLTATEDDLRKSLFGPGSVSEVMFVRLKGEVVAYFIFCPKIDTYNGKNEIYLDHLYVRPAYRRKGIGGAIMAHIGRVALERGATLIELFAVESNHDALKFYASLGGKRKDIIRVIRFEGKALKKLAKEYA
jgi:GNAT superfamily N-acetyltransferase